MPILKVMNPIDEGSDPFYRGLIIEPLENNADQLKALKDYLLALGFKEGIGDAGHYVVQEDKSGPNAKVQLRFSQKSIILRAAYTIALDQIKFEAVVERGLRHTAEQVKQKYINKRAQFSLTIPASRCYSSDVQLIQTASQEIFNFLKVEIKLVHDSLNSKASPVVSQLESDINLIENLKNENVFKNPKCWLLLASLLNAEDSEDKEKTITSSGRWYMKNIFSKFSEKKSVLQPLYYALFNNSTLTFIPKFSFRQNDEAYNKKIKEIWKQTYIKYVEALRPSSLVK